MELHNHVIDQVIAWSGKFGVGGTLTAIGSGATSKLTQAITTNPQISENVIQWSTVGVWCGIAMGFAGFMTQAYYSHRKDQRDEEKRVEERAEEERKRVIHEMQKRILDEKLDIKFTKDGMIE